MWIDALKKIVRSTPPPCYAYCPKSSHCPKLSKYEKKLEEIREVMKPRLDRNVKDDRKKLPLLVKEARRLRWNISKCIAVRKRLTDEGYHMWYPISD